MHVPMATQRTKVRGGIRVLNPSGRKVRFQNAAGVVFLILTSALMSFSQAASAEDYYWVMGYWRNNGTTTYRSSSPDLICKEYVKFQTAHFATYDVIGTRLTYENTKLISIKPSARPDVFVCEWSWDNYNRKTRYFVGTTIQLSETGRIGSTCPLYTKYNATLGTCSNDAQKGAPPENSCAGNPINFAIGNKFQSESDYQASTNSPLSFTRSYNSLDGIWRHGYSTHLRLAGTSYLSLVMADGRESFFTVNGTTVTASPTELGKLVKLTDGWQYTAKNNERFSFDVMGRLTRWINATGLEQQLNYSGSTVTVTDTLGHSLSFTEDANHQPLSLTVNGLQISYSFNANNRLSQLRRTQSGQTEQRSFHYEDSRNANLLTGITDERGVRYATWTYDDKGRATSSEHAGGIEHTDVAYNADGSSTVTNELGKKVTYRFQAIDGIKRITAIEGEPSANCPNSNSTFIYDSRGLLKTKTDNKGHQTAYEYSTRGLEVSRIEAAGTPQARTITTEWHPTLLLPVTVTEPARITTYTYDAQGRQLSQSVTQR